ncbi:MAG: hypothetical protein FWD24_00445 [Treponema sp.]|nr:hypothetical protein [Treponema sp.]
MKRFLLVSIFLFCFILNGNASPNCTSCSIQRSINVAISSGWSNQEEVFNNVIQLSANGELKYWSKAHKSLNERLNNQQSAVYHIRSNVIFITWDDGTQETARINFSNGRYMVTFRGIMLNEFGSGLRNFLQSDG